MADKLCELCGHVLTNNLHGFDQNDAWMEGDKLVHSGRCTYCIICNPSLGKLRFPVGGVEKLNG